MELIISILLSILSFRYFILFSTYIVKIIRNISFWKTNKNKYAVVSGSTGDIGKELCRQLLHKFNTIPILIGRDEEKLKDLQEELDHEDVQYYIVDYSKPATEEEYENIFKTMPYEKIGMLFNCAGISSKFPMSFIEETRIDNIISVNITSTINITRFFLKKIPKNNYFSVFTFGSMLGQFTVPLYSIYSASKSFLHKWSTALYYEMKGRNVHCEYVDIFYVSTQMSKVRPSVFAPEPYKFVKALLQTIGSGKYLIPYLPHQIQYSFVQVMPQWLISRVLYFVNGGIRYRALKKYNKVK